MGEGEGDYPFRPSIGRLRGRGASPMICLGSGAGVVMVDLLFG